jgi:hypothetical protein
VNQAVATRSEIEVQVLLTDSVSITQSNRSYSVCFVAITRASHRVSADRELSTSGLLV